MRAKPPAKMPARNRYEYETCLVASTAHVTPQDAELLEADAEAKVVDGVMDVLLVYQYPEGFFLWCPRDLDCFQEETAGAAAAGYSPALVNLMRLARYKKCKWLHLDRDGPTYHGYPVFDW